jgi:hypothetical protein
MLHSSHLVRAAFLVFLMSLTSYRLISQENLDYFFQFVPNREVACKAVDRLHHAFKKYSTDKDHALTSNQLRAFFENELPQAVSSGW